jgi:putative endonuclease
MAGLVPAIHVLPHGRWLHLLYDRSTNGILYIGVTNDLVRRVFEHRSGFVKGFTKQYGLKRLVYFEKFETMPDAIKREHNIKHWPRAWKVRLIVASNPERDDLFETISK